MRLLAAALLALSMLGASARAQEARLLDSFDDISAWRADASDGLTVAAASAPGHDGAALRLDFDFNDVSGYAFVGRDLPLTFPDNFEISFWMRAEASVNTLEIKFIDASGENVWWRNQRDFSFPSEWTRVVIRKRQIEFAWGPTTDRALRQTQRMEIVVTRGAGGGRGSVLIDQLEIRELPVMTGPLAPFAASASYDSDNAALAFDADAASAWRAPSGHRTITFDLGGLREFSGVELNWSEREHARDYEVSLSDDGETWRPARNIANGDGGADTLFLPDSEARFLRFELKRSAGRRYGLANVTLHPPEWAANPNAFVEALARAAPRGVYPRGFLEQSYWTLVGVDGAAESALVSEDGAVEIGQGGFSIEPFVRGGSRTWTWADVAVTQSLQDGYLPIPSVEWQGEGWRLETTAFADGDRDTSSVTAHYTLTNTGSATRSLDLVLAVRPLQVNGPRQFLNRRGGVAPIETLSVSADTVVVDGAPRVWLAERPTRFAANRLDSGLAPFASSNARAIADETGFASGQITYRVSLRPGQSRTFVWCAPLTGAQVECGRDVQTRQDAVAAGWRARLNVVDIDVPEAGQRVVDTLRTSLAHILMSREGPILKPGTRSYDRSWIRDGAMIAEGLIQLGATNEANDYLRWFAPYQFDTGKIPCCVDSRGADPTPENDSHGEFIYLVAEVWRAARDEALLREVWPRVVRAVAYMDEQRTSEMAPNRAPARRHLYGLMPPSISHEGYSSRPAYSYWDDFWTLLGYKEAVELARAMGDADAERRFIASRDAFRRDLYASISAMRRVHGIDFIPGAADLGDFDATSTTIALTPGGELARLPRAPLEATFERYWREFVERREGRRQWDAYTPYEIRNVGAFVRLGWRDRANELLAYFFDDRRPQAWNGWAEVVGRDAREHRFIGDMPHAWISSDYIRSALELFAYDDDAAGALVIAAGIPEAWLDGSGVSVRGLRTPYGQVSYAIRRDAGELVLEIDGDIPPGGFVLPWPLSSRPSQATFNGEPIALRDDAYRLDARGRLAVRTRPATP
jgi:hypothetical protein